MYTKSLKIPQKKLLEFSKVVGYKINIQKAVTFLNINDELYEKKIKQSDLQ